MHKNTLKKPNSQLHPNSLSPTRQENTILSFYAAARLLGIISNSPIEIILNLHPPIRKVYAIKLFYSKRLSCFLCHCSHSNLTLGSDTSCREFNQNSNLWETKQIEKTHAKEKNNHTHKIVFTWFGNFPTSTELQRFHYYQERIQSTPCGYNIFSLYQTRQQHHTKKP